MEELASLGNLEDTKTEGNLNYAVHLFEPTHALEEELLHSKKGQAPLCLHNLLSLSHLPTRKTSNKELLVDYNQFHVVTFDEYL